MKTLPDSDVTPVLRADQAWHLARMAAFREASEIVRSCGAGTIDAAVAAAELDRDAREAWARYIDSIARFERERVSFLNLYSDVTAELSDTEGTPVVHWHDHPSVDMGLFGEFIVPEDPAAGTARYALSDPFMPLNLTALAAGSQYWRIIDTRHTATAAVAEFSKVLSIDVKRILAASQGDDCWRTLISHAHLLQQGAETSLSYLGHDHFRGWDPRIPTLTRLDQAPAYIDQHATTTTAQQRLALHYVAEYFRRLITTAEEHHQDRTRRAEALSEELLSDLDSIQRLYDELNTARMRAEGIAPEHYTALIAFRPKGLMHPVFVAIPVQSTDTVAQIEGRAAT